jgi:undecaprenyl-diphosphatase
LTVFYALILGLVQGVTEFLPVSSSAHLVIVPQLFNMPAPTVAFDVLLHLGTLVAVVGFFIQDIANIVKALFLPKLMGKEGVRYWRRVFFWLVIGSIPAAIIGAALNGFFEDLFSSTAAVGIFLLVTSVLLTVADFVTWRARRIERQGVSLRQMTWPDAAIVGCFQALAIAPGLSRSGSTISAGVFLGFDRETAARFAFLLSIPAILGAFLFKLKDLGGGSGGYGGAALAIGFLAAAVSGFLAVRFMMHFLKSHRMWPFAVYTLVVGVFVIVLSLA